MARIFLSSGRQTAEQMSRKMKGRMDRFCVDGVRTHTRQLPVEVSVCVFFLYLSSLSFAWICFSFFLPFFLSSLVRSLL